MPVSIKRTSKSANARGDVQKALKAIVRFQFFAIPFRECVRNLDLRMQVHPGELWGSKQRVHIVLEASKSAGAKGHVPKICGFVHPLHPC